MYFSRNFNFMFDDIHFLSIKKFLSSSIQISVSKEIVSKKWTIFQIEDLPEN